MAKKQVSAPAAAPTNRPPYMLIEEIRVQGYKSLVDATLHVRPLTLLAGTNSSGKSSIMQPLLLIKQTMEAPYQPAGALVLNGAHVQAETAGELVSTIDKNRSKFFSLKLSGKQVVGLISFKRNFDFAYKQNDSNFAFVHHKSTTISDKAREFCVTPESTWTVIHSQLDSDRQLLYNLEETTGEVDVENGFLVFIIRNKEGEIKATLTTIGAVENMLSSLMHIPGLRRRPERSYAATFFKEQIKGTFDAYGAGLISQWQQQQDAEKQKLAKLNDYLRRLGLTDSVTAKVKNANEVELSVSRLPAGGKAKPRKADMVNIADVGIGVSQVLPILVALIAAQEGQIVYVEQPELHLHPRAQVAMAELLAEAANRGVRVIVETHSSLLLLTVQTLIAKSEIKNTDVALHWFARDAKGATRRARRRLLMWSRTRTGLTGSGRKILAM